MASTDIASTPATVNEGGDELAFAPLQLNVAVEQRGMHQKNAGPDEVQRPDVLDDLCLGLHLQSRIDRVVHGRAEKDGPLTTLVVFGFRFHGLDGKRRFKKAIITILFGDEKSPGTLKDPTVVGLWPNGDFTLGDPTPVEVEETKGGEVGGDIGAPVSAGVQLGAHVARTWEKKTRYSQSHRATLTGSIVLDMKVREYGPKNAVRLTLFEDDAAESGIITDFRAAVLLQRRNDTDVFTAKVRMTGTAHFLYNIFRGFRNVTPFSPANDAVRFKPGVQYLRPPTFHPKLEANLSVEINETDISADKLEKVAGVLGSTALVMQG
jgi:hypothetical protein